MEDLKNKSKEELIKEIKSLRLKIELEKETSSELNNIDNQIHMLIRQSPIVIEIYDLDGLQIEVNKAYEELWGVPASTTVNKFNVLKSQEVISTGLIDYVNSAYNGESVIVPEYEFNPTGESEAQGQGRIRWLSTRIFPLKDSSGKVVNIVITHEDISNIKEIQYENELIYNAFNNAVTGFDLIDESGKYIYVNDAWLKVWGYEDKSEILRTTPENRTIDPNTPKEIQSKLRQYGKYTKETVGIRKDGSTFDLKLSAFMFKDSKGKNVFFTSTTDITEKKKTDEALRKSENRFRTLANIAPTGIFITDNNGDFTYANPHWLSMNEMLLQESLGNGWSNGIHPDDKSEVLRTWNNSQEKRQTWRMEFRFLTPSGKLTWVDSHADPFFDEKGDIAGYIGINLDITSHRNTEKELKDHQDNLEKVIEARTEELEKKNKELDSAMKVFVGRELKIKELQDKLNALDME